MGTRETEQRWRVGWSGWGEWGGADLLQGLKPFNERQCWFRGVIEMGSFKPLPVPEENPQTNISQYQPSQGKIKEGKNTPSKDT